MSRRDYCFTDFSDGEDKFDWDKIKYIIYGNEICPETGKKHKQGFVVFTTTCRIPGASKRLGLKGVHLEARRGTRQQARDYCAKDGDYFEWGEFDPMTKEQLFGMAPCYLIKNYPEFYQRYWKVIEKSQPKGDKWRKITVTWLWGKAGCGKTRKVMEMDDVYKLDFPYKWFDGYEGESILLIDDYEDQAIHNGFLKNILDGYILKLEVKCSHTYALWTKIFITSNNDPKKMSQWSEALERRVHHIVSM